MRLLYSTQTTNMRRNSGLRKMKEREEERKKAPTQGN
jgi:hypothetical protein